MSEVGFAPEIYEKGEEGFRTQRDPATGLPAKPEVVAPSEDDITTDSNVKVVK